MTTDRILDEASRRCAAPKLVVVTGVCGFIGSHLAEALLGGDGVRVLGVDRMEPGRDPRTAAIMTVLQGRPGFRLLSADVGDAAVAARLFEATAVVHLAAPTDVAASWGAGFADQTRSLLSSHRLLDACWRARVPRVVVASSAHVYGRVDGLAREDVPVEPTSPYGVTKLATERLAVAYARRPGSATSAVALRFFTAFGPRGNPAMVVPRMFRSALTGKAMPLFGDGTAAHTWTHVDDLVAAVLCGIDLPLEAGQTEVVNAAGRDEASLRQVGDLVGQIVGRPVVWEPAGNRPGDAAGVRADLTRARQVLGFAPRIGLRQGLETLWQHLQEPARAGDPRPLPA
ncbi:MAG: NAD-dependent epimerase/dehydratase family protein [Candidatus Dormibacteria bacterium]